MSRQHVQGIRSRRLLIYVLGALGSVILLWQITTFEVKRAGAQLNLQKVDDFESYTLGSLFGQGGWVSTPGVTVVQDPDPNYSENQVMKVDGGFNIATNFLADANERDLFFRIYRDGPIDGFGGGSNSAAPTGVAQYESQVGSSQGSDEFSIRSGDVFSDTQLAFSANTWHCVWISQNEDQYTVHIKGGDALNPELQGTYLNRNESEDPSVTFLAAHRNDLGGDLFIDDIYSGDDMNPFDQHVPGCPGGIDNIDTDGVALFTEEDFSQYPLGSFENGSNTGLENWDSAGTSIELDPADGTNQVLALRGDDAHAKRLIEDGLTSRDEIDSATTFFYRFYRSGMVNGFGGTSDERLSPTSFDSFITQMGLQTATQNDLLVRDGDQFLATEFSIADNTWYCVWQHHYYEDNAYRSYILGGEFTEPTLIQAGQISLYDYRASEIGIISDFYARTGSGHTGLMMFDDIALLRNIYLTLPSSISSSDCGRMGTPVEPVPTPTVTPSPLPSLTPSLTPTNMPPPTNMAPPVNTATSVPPTSTPVPPVSTSLPPTAVPTVAPITPSPEPGNLPTATPASTVAPPNLDRFVFLPMIFDQ